MNSRTLVIGNKNYSSWSLRPWFFLRKNHIEFTEQQMWLDVPQFKDDVSRYGSGGKVPVLLDSGVEVWDSLAIIEYAIDRFGCDACWPTDIKQRAHARSIVCEMHSSFFALRDECPMDIRGRHAVVLSEAAQVDVRRICTIWTQALNMSGNRACWLYENFSVADAMFAPVVFRLNSFGIEVDPLIQSYIDFVLSDEILAEWINAANAETAYIEI